MPNPRVLQYLQNVGANASAHSGRELLDHLLGVHRVLQEWSARPALCDAGLFHSVYGTESYSVKTLPISRRREIEGLIGTEAENLVYLFCAKDGERFIASLSSGTPYSIYDRIENKIVPISPEGFSDLTELSMANVLEQIPYVAGFLGKHRIATELTRWNGARGVVSKQAEAALLRGLALYDDYEFPGV